jgi:hypothetical protein
MKDSAGWIMKAKQRHPFDKQKWKCSAVCTIWVITHCVLDQLLEAE